jgi:dipeptidyl aminopeptidase/acylaminoacyl peptidase
MKPCVLFIFLLHYCINCYSQSSLPLHYSGKSKPPIDSEAITNWASLESEQFISNNGKYVCYTINNDPVGFQTLVIQSTSNNWRTQLINKDIGVFSPDSRKFIYQSNDTLFFLSLGTGNITYITNVKSYKQSSLENDGWMAYLLKNGNQELVLRNLSTNKEKRFPMILDYIFSPDGKVLLLQSQNSISHSISLVDLSSLGINIIWQEKRDSDKSVAMINCQFDKASSQIAFITNDTTLWYYRIGMKTAQAKIKENISPTFNGLTMGNQSPSFSSDGHYILFSLLSPQPKTQIPTPNAVKVDIWSYRDSVLPFEQSADLQRHNYLAAVNIKNNQVVQIQHENEMLFESNGEFAILTDRADIPVMNYWWPSYNEKSYWLVSLKDGSRKRLSSLYEWSNLAFSPGGKYIVYYDQKKKYYCSYQLHNDKIRGISPNVRPELFNRQSDERYPFQTTPPVVKGIAGWVSNDKAVLVYDDYDIWELDLEGKKQPLNLTNGYGRIKKIKFQIVGQYFENKSFHDKSLVLLSAFDTQNKYSGFYQLRINESKNPCLLTMGPYTFQHPLKAALTDIWIVQRESATEAPNYYITRDLKTYTILSDLQPQTFYNWLTTELVKWKQLDGTTNQGVLYKPENFDPQKKYPLIFHYYEEKSQNMYKFLQPKYSTDVIDIPWYVSRGYLVFTPDIHYGVASVTGKVNGDYVVNAIVSAAAYLSGLPYIDSKRLGLQGHSFGGGETLYLITHSNLFAAACAASSTVSNEVTAYLGISRVHGNPISSKMMHSEIGHNKIGATLWQRPDLYIKASPVFRADKVSTPLLLMHNLEDGVCDWNQSAEMFMALRRLRKKVWLLQYDNGDHLVPAGQCAIDYTTRMQQFFDHYLKDAPPPVWMTQGIPAYLKGVKTGLELDDNIKL